MAAARVILEFSFRGAEIADLEERLEAIEAQLAAAAEAESLSVVPFGSWGVPGEA